MILVTGATGFLGSILARQLAEQNNRLRCIKRSTSVIPDLLTPYQHLIEWTEADMLDIFALEDAFEGITQVYHCAAWVSFKEADKKSMISTNITGTANVVELCLQYGARLVHVSSIAAIGAAKEGELITEKHHLEETPANNGYAISKLESEMEVWRGIAEGLDAVIVNPSVIIGPTAGTDGSGQIFETVRRGLKFYTRGSCGLVDVEDVARCIIALMNSSYTAERYIINAENWYFKDLTAAIAQCFGIKPPTTEAKPWMLAVAWRAASFWASVTGTAPSLDKIAAQSATVVQNYDNAKIKQATGIAFKPVTDTIAEICAVLKN
ncbi:NAD-dependent epimerase/dehydratase family protein [Mucilaginibacter sp. Bleaf8]|uniref:NAD-dependent epimerase/dehydratase family protein n=1 Tax=Mucilaginibacter sp. Bleaf8 TaxID=2834430 RepID=UPI001BCD5703|nr:NAD-dependent epimerase/dehydratase family protein [Mucilaginibacter sp. Bleaf8]MBS7566096.1 NAD-dependent epimerase/dehydratase family protein [Mucilaginibacter sp. Bleaf8]